MDDEFRRWVRRPVACRLENMTTHALERCHGTLRDGTPMSVFAKTLHPASESPYFQTIPEEHRAPTLEALNWRDEPRLYRCGLGDRLPAPLRMPTVHAIDESPDRITLWLEDVDDVTPWDLDRYRRTAEALGRLGGAWPGERAVAELGLGSRDIGALFFGKIMNFDLPIQSDGAFWSRPAVAAAVDARHRCDLFALAERMPAMIARLSGLPTGICHGDATPDNFREPGDGSIVGIDWAYGSVGALGSDLGQLFVGRYESGVADVDDLEAIAATILDGYLAGLEIEGIDVDPASVERAWVMHMAIRSVFSALVVDHRPDLDADEYAELVRRRAALARFGLDLVARH